MVLDDESLMIFSSFFRLLSLFILYYLFFTLCVCICGLLELVLVDSNIL
jgi:hypothetical protein